MKLSLSIILFLWLSGASASLPPKYKVHIVTWNRDRITGRVESVTDSTISIKINKGKVFTFSAAQTRNLKIWKPGINLPIMVVGAVVGPFIIRQMFSSGNDEWGLAGVISVILGVPIGSAAGLAVGDAVSTKYNQRRMHISNFEDIKEPLGLR
jgi:hypothetical protein